MQLAERLTEPYTDSDGFDAAPPRSYIEGGCLPTRHLLRSVRAITSSFSSRVCFRIRGVPLCLIRLPCVRVSAGSSPDIVQPDPPSRRRRDGRRSAALTGRKQRETASVCRSSIHLAAANCKTPCVSFRTPKYPRVCALAP